jgi:hypothetical protein
MRLRRLPGPAGTGWVPTGTLWGETWNQGAGHDLLTPIARSCATPRARTPRLTREGLEVGVLPMGQGKKVE